MVSERRARQAEAVLQRRLNGLVVVCENFGNPHNAAAVLRTCEAMGILNVYIVEELQPTALHRQITAGAEQWLEVHRCRRVKAALDEVRSAGYKIFAATPGTGALELEELPCDQRLALLFGNEQEGVTSEALAQADGTFTIPMHGFVRSLNVAAAAAIAIHHCARRRRAAHGPGDLSPAELASLRGRYLEL